MWGGKRPHRRYSIFRTSFRRPLLKPPLQLLGCAPFTRVVNSFFCADQILIPACLDELEGKSPLTGKQIPLIVAGGIFDGRGLAAALSYGAEAVWVGTRFVASVEARAPKAHKEP